jgi:hypothetical protein
MQTFSRIFGAEIAEPEGGKGAIELLRFLISCVGSTGCTTDKLWFGLALGWLSMGAGGNNIVQAGRNEAI